VVVAQIHGYAIPTPSFLIELNKKNKEVNGEGIVTTEEKSSYSGTLKAKDCQIQNGSNSCSSQIIFEFPKN
jgi:hypothetical protein